jgi:hypothetical protein
MHCDHAVVGDGYPGNQVAGCLAGQGLVEIQRAGRRLLGGEIRNLRGILKPMALYSVRPLACRKF